MSFGEGAQSDVKVRGGVCATRGKSLRDAARRPYRRRRTVVECVVVRRVFRTGCRTTRAGGCAARDGAGCTTRAGVVAGVGVVDGVGSAATDEPASATAGVGFAFDAVLLSFTGVAACVFALDEAELRLPRVPWASRPVDGAVEGASLVTTANCGTPALFIAVFH